MSEVIVVGAGLAGLTAAINCARAGHEVRVLEKHDRIGGDPLYHPSVDATPLLPDAMGKMLGLELKPPYAIPVPELNIYVYGRRMSIEGRYQYLHAVERGSRSTSIESYLYQEALDRGVKFEFGWKLGSQKDALELPPGTIIATGLHYEPFLALGIPFIETYGYFANFKHEGPPSPYAWFDSFAGDYCYFGNANGIGFALAFDRYPMKKEAREHFSERVRLDLGVVIEDWVPLEGAVGVKSISNPRLFVGDKILAGTLAGMQDPLWFFGVHSCLISGHIAAQAVDDKAAALERFGKLTSLYKYSFLGRKVFELMPHPVRKSILGPLYGAQCRWPEKLGGLALPAIPGFSDLRKG